LPPESLSKFNGSDAMSSTLTRWQPTVDGPWDVRRVVHLHRRAGFAPGWEQINRLKAWWLYRMLNTADPLGERLTLMWKESNNE